MAYVMKTGNVYRILDEDSIEITDRLAPLTYTVKLDQRSGEFFLETIDTFTLPKKLYGDTIQKADRVLATFNARTSSTGVHLDGAKGSGKTLLAKAISVKAQQQGLATIVVNQPYCGDEFNAFMQRIDIPAVVIFDEFEKTYNYEHQNKILTLFDGVYPTKKLFIITTNENYGVSTYLKNRPGRMYYSFKYDTLDQTFIQEYLEDNLIDKSKIESVVKYTQIFSFFNFDMLAAAVEEMNRYNESLHDVLNYLNIVPENKKSEQYVVKLTMQGQTVTLQNNNNNYSPTETAFEFWGDTVTGLLNDANSALLRKEFFERYEDDDPQPVSLSDSDDENFILVFNGSHLVQFDSIKNTFIYERIGSSGKKIRLEVERVQSATYSYKDLF